MTKSEERNELRRAARELDRRITAAVTADYPNLYGYALRVPAYTEIVATGEEWQWRSYRSASAEIRALRSYMGRATHVAASRISQAYGQGAGAAWADRHGLASPGDSDALARASAVASLAAVGANG